MSFSTCILRETRHIVPLPISAVSDLATRVKVDIHNISACNLFSFAQYTLYSISKQKECILLELLNNTQKYLIIHSINANNVQLRFRTAVNSSAVNF
jgi:precorrin-6B methylase 1